MAIVITTTADTTAKITNSVGFTNETFLTVGKTTNKISEFVRAGVIRAIENEFATDYFLAVQNSALILSVNHISGV